MLTLLAFGIMPFDCKWNLNRSVIVPGASTGANSTAHEIWWFSVSSGCSMICHVSWRWSCYDQQRSEVSRLWTGCESIIPQKKPAWLILNNHERLWWWRSTADPRAYPRAGKWNFSWKPVYDVFSTQVDQHHSFFGLYSCLQCSELRVDCDERDFFVEVCKLEGLGLVATLSILPNM